MKQDEILNLIHRGALSDSCLYRIERQLKKLKEVNPLGYEITLKAWESRNFSPESFFRFVWDENNGFRGENALISLY